MHSGKPQDQSLAIAYNMRKKMKKMSEGGEVNEDLHPEHNSDEALATADIDHLSMSAHDQSHGQLPQPAEPKEHIMPGAEDMGRNNPIGERIVRALNMAMGGSVEEQHKPIENEDRRLAMNDTYPPGKAESDTQAQDEGFGDAPMDSEEGDPDQERNRSRMSRALESVRMNHMYPNRFKKND